MEKNNILLIIYSLFWSLILKKLPFTIISNSFWYHEIFAKSSSSLWKNLMLGLKSQEKSNSSY